MPTVLITGCSSGIGLDAARHLQSRGWTVFATCRTEADLAEIVAHDPRCRQALRRLVQGGRLVPTRDRVQRREIVFHTDAIALARRHLASGFPPPTPFLVAEAGRILGISRKFSVPLLEHLDARGFTRRDGDRRVIVAGAALGEVIGMSVVAGATGAGAAGFVVSATLLGFVTASGARRKWS